MAGACNLHDSDRIVVEDRRDIFGGELVCRIRNQQTRFPDCTVPNNNTSKRKGQLEVDITQRIRGSE